MNAEQFTWWLHGFFEISKAEALTKEQVSEIKNHLDLLFKKETPTSVTKPDSMIAEWPPLEPPIQLYRGDIKAKGRWAGSPLEVCQSTTPASC